MTAQAVTGTRRCGKCGYRVTAPGHRAACGGDLVQLVRLARVQLAARREWAPLLIPPPVQVERRDFLAWMSPACLDDACHNCEWPDRCKCACEHGWPA